MRMVLNMPADILAGYKLYRISKPGYNIVKYPGLAFKCQPQLPDTALT